MATFLIKTEPGDYSFDQLLKDKSTIWSGVTNPTALIHLRAMKKGDDALVYHTGDQKAIVGLARVTAGASEDPRRPGRNDRGEPKFAVVGIAARKAAKTPVTLTSLRADARFKDFLLVTQSRLSVMPVPAALDTLLRQMAGL